MLIISLRKLNESNSVANIKRSVSISRMLTIYFHLLSFVIAYKCL